MSNEQSAKRAFLKSWVFKAILIVAGYLFIVGVMDGIDKNLKGEWTTFTTQNSPLLDNQITALITDENGRVWVGTSEGLCAIEPDGTWIVYTRENSNLLDKRIENLVIDKLGNLWVGTRDGLFVVEESGNWTTYIKYDRFYRSDTYIRSLAVDKNNQLWVGTRYGLYVLNNTYEVVANYTKKNSGLVDDKVNVLAVDDFNRIWIGTEGQGVSVYDQNGNWTTYKEDSHGLTSNRITAFLFDKQNRVWIGTQFGGINILDANGNLITDRIININSEYGHYDVGDIALDTKGRIWVEMGEESRQILTYVGYGTIYTNHNSRLPSHVSRVKIDLNNRLWVGTWSSGLIMIDLQKELPKTVPYRWVIALKLIHLPMEIVIATSEEISEIFGYFWYGLIPIMIMFLVSAIGIHQGRKQKNSTIVVASVVSLIITIVITIFFCNFMMMAMMSQA